MVFVEFPEEARRIERSHLRPGKKMNLEKGKRKRTEREKKKEKLLPTWAADGRDARSQLKEVVHGARLPAQARAFVHHMQHMLRISPLDWQPH